MFRRTQPSPTILGERNFKARLANGTTILICTTPQLVRVYHFEQVGKEATWAADFLLSENPELIGLYHPQLGWDIVALVGLLWRQIDTMATFNLRDPEVRSILDSIGTVSGQSQHTPKRQEHRSIGDTYDLIVRALRDSERAMTRLQIARAINRKKSPRLNLIIEGMVANGWLERTVIKLTDKQDEFYYVLVGDNLPSTD